MKADSKRKDLLIALGLNIIFFIAFVFVIGPKYETNDDLALSFLVEGAYGTRTPYMVYSNVLWGKLLVALYSLMPMIKWYVVLMLGMLYTAFTGMTYMILRLQGKKVGTVVSTAVLLFLGYYSYVVFQYSRIAPVVTAVGLLLLFYGIEHAETKCEKRICFVVGTLMAVWGSLVRFQMFAVAVVLAGGAIGLYKVWTIWKAKETDWLKQIGTYVAVFGTVGVLGLGCLVVDKMSYSSEEWKYYNEFNAVRTELWDYGFPDYAENADAFEAIGVSEKDYEYYQTWNMDEESMTIENLQTIADKKPEKSFNLFGYLSVFPKYFFSISVFIVFLIVSIIALDLSWKNLYFILFEGAAIMVFEAYFYYIGRYGIARVDNGMWMVAVLTLVYAISKDLVKVEDALALTWKKVIFLVGAVAILFVADFVRVPLVLDGIVNESKTFYEEIKKDDEHLYIMTAKAPKLYYGFDIWEPSELGELSNVYNAFGWEFNHEVKSAALDEYDISNIYRDTINNEKVYFVTNDENEILQTYIQENYDANARLVKVREVEGVAIYSLCSQ